MPDSTNYRQMVLTAVKPSRFRLRVVVDRPAVGTYYSYFNQLLWSELPEMLSHLLTSGNRQTSILRNHGNSDFSFLVYLCKCQPLFFQTAKMRVCDTRTHAHRHTNPFPAPYSDPNHHN